MLELLNLLECPSVIINNNLDVIENNNEYTKEYNSNSLNSLLDENSLKVINKFIKEKQKEIDIISQINQKDIIIKIVKADKIICTLKPLYDNEIEKLLTNIYETEKVYFFLYSVEQKTITINNLHTISIFDKRLKSFIFRRDIKKVEELLKSSKEKSTLEIRILNKKTRKFEWYKLNLFTFSSKKVGVCININDKVEDEEKYQRFLSLDRMLFLNAIFAFRINITKNTCVKEKSRFSTKNIYSEFENVNKTTELLSILSNLLKEGDRSILDSKRLAYEWELGNIKQRQICKLLLKDKSSIWIELCIDIIKNPYTDEIEGLIYANNVNKEKELKQIINNVIDANYDFISSIDLNSKYVSFFNKDTTNNNLTIRKCLYNTMCKQYLSEFVSKEEQKDHFANLSFGKIVKVISKSKNYLYTIPVMSKGEKRYKRWQFSLIENRNEVLLCCNDVTYVVSKEIEKQEELKVAVQKANDASLAKRRFLSQISHDIRTPMNGIMGLISLSLEENLPLKVKDNLEIVYNSSNYLLDLINNTLDMNKIEDNQLVLRNENFCLNELINDITDPLIFEIKRKNITFIKEIDFSNNIYVNSDKSRISQILVNILSNAIKYTDNGGEIKFKVSIEGKDEIKVFFTIIDNGIGMSEDFIPKLFDSYSREGRKTEEKGTGLGMYIVKGLIDLLDGRIKVKSKEAEGTSVSIMLPFGTVTKEKPQESVKQYSLNDLNILLVDDDPINIKVGKMFLERVDANVFSAASGEEAVNMFISSPENFFSVILMDIRMPGINGYETSKIIRELKRIDSVNIPIIAMSANAFEEDILLSKNSGMNEHISKPVKAEILYQTILKVIEGN